MLNYITGNVLDVKEGIIAHGVNCRGAFGSGVAGQIRQRFPNVYNSYMYKHNKIGWKLGDIQLVDIIPEKLIIANCATQDNYGRSEVHADYDAIGKCLDFLIDYCEEHSLALSLPKIGAGLAGGDWKIIEKIIQEKIQGRNVNITVYNYGPDKTSS